jgi:hypothetical protein
VTAAQRLAADLITRAYGLYLPGEQMPPTVVLDGPGRRVVLHPIAGHDLDPVEWAARLIAGLAGPAGATAAGFVSEAWYTTVEHQPGDPQPSLRPGELGERAAAGDPTVGTHMMVCAGDPEGHVTTLLRVPQLADDGTITWLDPTSGAEMTGRVPRLIREAFENAALIPPEFRNVDPMLLATTMTKLAPLMNAEGAVELVS